MKFLISPQINGIVNFPLLAQLLPTICLSCLWVHHMDSTFIVLVSSIRPPLTSSSSIHVNVVLSLPWTLYHASTIAHSISLHYLCGSNFLIFHLFSWYAISFYPYAIFSCPIRLAGPTLVYKSVLFLILVHYCALFWSAFIRTDLHTLQIYLTTNTQVLHNTHMYFINTHTHTHTHIPYILQSSATNTNKHPNKRTVDLKHV